MRRQPYLRGDQLPLSERLRLLATYTGRHRDPDYRDDEYWLATHKWPVTRTGRVDARTRWAAPCSGEEKESGIRLLVLRRMGVRQSWSW